MRDLEKVTGASLTPTGREAVASLLASAGRFEVGKPVKALGEDGAEIDVEAWFRATLTRFPAFIDTKANEKSPSAPAGNRTQQAIAKVAASRSSEGRIAIAKEAAQAGNPWRQGPTFNRTKQGLITNFDSNLAAKLRLEAGA
ncbi:hypothetical protein [Aureimonas sp. AU40]|uniref:hypothetical protein n=1 Tax=Aureimonas sp. AU40 TaxID=1637747 RepID=UPI0012E39B98|nr:hypothetical protein [Aureimonas sp. AU40]